MQNGMGGFAGPYSIAVFEADGALTADSKPAKTSRGAQHHEVARSGRIAQRRWLSGREITAHGARLGTATMPPNVLSVSAAEPPTSW